MQQTAWHAAYTTLQEKGVDTLTDAERELRRLPITEIQTMEALFQPRQCDDETSKSGAHLGELLRALKARGSLEPIVVLKAGGEWWVVDGHHRLEAYRRKAAEQSGRGKRLTYIPVKVLSAETLADAFDVSVEGNSQDRLNMTKEEKLEAAWQRVLLGVASASRISEVTSISERTVCTMRRSLERARMLHPSVPFETWAWLKVKLMLRGELKECAEMWDEAKAGEWSKLLARTFCGLPSQHPRVFAKALLRYDKEMAKVLAGELARLTAQKADAPNDF